MSFVAGIVLLVGGIVALLASRPKHGRPRFFVGTNLEPTIAIGLVMAIGFGTVLTIGGIAEMIG
jgi:hypothetical protein